MKQVRLNHKGKNVKFISNQKFFQGSKVFYKVLTPSYMFYYTNNSVMEYIYSKPEVQKIFGMNQLDHFGLLMMRKDTYSLCEQSLKNKKIFLNNFTYLACSYDRMVIGFSPAKEKYWHE